jgi:circadian clock protein KaiC
MLRSRRPVKTLLSPISAAAVGAGRGERSAAGGQLAADHRSPMSTGVPGLDVVLGGGLSRGGMYFFVGAPGTGKTVLTFEIAVHTARAHGPVLFLTALSEPHNKLLRHMRTFPFFDADLIGAGFELVNLQGLMAASMEATVETIVSTAHRSQAVLVAVDGFSSLGGFMETEHAARDFLYDLGAKLGLLNVTLLVTFQADPREAARSPEFTAADGLLALFYERHGAGHRRYLEVLKLRGASHLDGLHSVTINSDGLACYPQQESLPIEANPGFPKGRAYWDLPELDEMLGGGLNEGSVTLLAGGPGSGKTLACLHFLYAGAARGETGFLLGFHESRSQLEAKARGFGLDLAGAVAAGFIHIATYPAVRLDPDIVLHELRAGLGRAGVRRLVVDSSRLLERALHPARAPDFLASVVSYLRARHITTLLTHETSNLVGGGAVFSDTSVPALADNVLLFRHLEHRGRLRRFVSVLKMRFSEHATDLREFSIGSRGISVVSDIPAGEDSVTGVAGGPGDESG